MPSENTYIYDGNAIIRPNCWDIWHCDAIMFVEGSWRI